MFVEGWIVKVRFWYRFHVASQSDGTLRSRVAWFFRRFATLIDGKPSVSMDIASTPCVNNEERQEIVHYGIDLAAKMFKEAVRREAMEEGMREAMPELYGEGSCKTKP